MQLITEARLTLAQGEGGGSITALEEEQGRRGVRRTDGQAALDRGQVPLDDAWEVR